ncbi:MAG: hypothetical protein HRT61_01210 [Ekhidna sp.]|nr:hypothetical protein [Ekhidna sp.]
MPANGPIHQVNGQDIPDPTFEVVNERGPDGRSIRITPLTTYSDDFVETAEFEVRASYDKVLQPIETTYWGPFLNHPRYLNSCGANQYQDIWCRAVIKNRDRLMIENFDPATIATTLVEDVILEQRAEDGVTVTASGVVHSFDSTFGGTVDGIVFLKEITAGKFQGAENLYVGGTQIAMTYPFGDINFDDNSAIASEDQVPGARTTTYSKWVRYPVTTSTGSPRFSVNLSRNRITAGGSFWAEYTPEGCSVDIPEHFAMFKTTCPSAEPWREELNRQRFAMNRNERPGFILGDYITDVGTSTYTVEMRLRKKVGSEIIDYIHTETFDITVDDPEVVYVGNQTIFINAAGTVPPGYPGAVAFTNWTDAEAEAVLRLNNGLNARILFNRGETYTGCGRIGKSNTLNQVRYPNSSVTIGSYGTGELPLLENSAAEIGCSCNELIIRDLKLDQGFRQTQPNASPPTRGQSGGIDVANALHSSVIRNDVRGCEIGLSVSPGSPISDISQMVAHNSLCGDNIVTDWHNFARFSGTMNNATNIGNILAFNPDGWVGREKNESLAPITADHMSDRTSTRLGNIHLLYGDVCFTNGSWANPTTSIQAVIRVFGVAYTTRVQKICIAGVVTEGSSFRYAATTKNAPPCPHLTVIEALDHTCSKSPQELFKAHVSGLCLRNSRIAQGNTGIEAATVPAVAFDIMNEGAAREYGVKGSKRTPITIVNNTIINLLDNTTPEDAGDPGSDPIGFQDFSRNGFVDDPLRSFDNVRIANNLYHTPNQTGRTGYVDYSPLNTTVSGINPFYTGYYLIEPAELNVVITSGTEAPDEGCTVEEYDPTNTTRIDPSQTGIVWRNQGGDWTGTDSGEKTVTMSSSGTKTTFTAGNVVRFVESGVTLATGTVQSFTPLYESSSKEGIPTPQETLMTARPQAGSAAVNGGSFDAEVILPWDGGFNERSTTNCTLGAWEVE